MSPEVFSDPSFVESSERLAGDDQPYPWPFGRARRPRRAAEVGKSLAQGVGRRDAATLNKAHLRDRPMDSRIDPSFRWNQFPCIMLYVVTSNKSLDQVCADLAEAVVAHKFGLLATHNLRETMAKKGVDFDRECRIFEVCNPHQAKKVLESRMEVSTALPCRISVFEEEGKVRLATMKPSMMLGIFEAPGLDSVAAEVETSIMAIMQDAAG